MCKFIDQYITCSIPEVEGKLKELVLQLQNHKHSSYCKRSNSCRFGFPHSPSDNTLIAEPCEPCEHSTDPIETLKKVCKVLAGGGCDDLNLDEILAKAKVTSDDYQNALSVSNNGSVVVLKHKPKECNINNYNVPVLLAWQANMDLQICPECLCMCHVCGLVHYEN